MKRFTFSILIVFLAACTPSDQERARDKAREAGREIKHEAERAGQEIKHGAEELNRKAGPKLEEAGREIKQETERAAEKVKQSAARMRSNDHSGQSDRKDK